MTQANDKVGPASAAPVEQELGPLPERVAAAGCPPPGWVEPGVVPSPVGRLYTQAELYAAVAAERERCARICESEPERKRGDGVWVADQLACAEAIRGA